jgi:hypothetical protein
MFSPSNGTTLHQLLRADEPGRSYHLEFDDCAEEHRQGQISMQLSVDGQLLEGTSVSVPGVDGACLQLDFKPAAASTLELVVHTTPDFLPAGDFSLQFR